MKISVFGAGYVGLVTASCLAELGHHVIITDKSKEKIDAVRRGKAPFYEPGLNALISKNIASKRLIAPTDPKFAVKNSEITFVCVGTPAGDRGSTDLSQVHSTIRQIVGYLKQKKGRHIIAVKSTVPPGTTKSLISLLKENGKKEGFGICMNPEFLREGTAVHDFMHPDRTVIGSQNKRDAEVLERLFRKVGGPIVKTDLETAEMIKYASNAFLATKISFINEIARICEKFNVDVYDVADGIGYDRRIGRAFLNAGVGWGGGCFGKDLSSLIHESKKHRHQPLLLRATVKVNERLADHLVGLARENMKLKGKKVAVLGLSFKPETSDIRESPAIKVIGLLLQEGAKVIAYDPKAADNAREIFKGKIRFAGSAADALRGSECCFILTEWSKFKKLGAGDFRRLMKTPLVVDGRAVYNPRDFKQKGVLYRGIGRPKL